MREITLNPDGVLNILDPRKLYVLEINWTYSHRDPEYFGKKYYLPYKGDNYIEFRRLNAGSHFYCCYNSTHIQYLVDGLFRYMLRVCNRQWTTPHVYEFNSMEEFDNWRKS